MKFCGVMPALVTPLKEDNKSINTEVAKELIEFHMGQGADGFYVLGGTGEGLLIEEKERMIMCEAAIDAVSHRKPVIVHVAAMNTEETIRLAKHAEKAGADAVSAVPPFYFAYDVNDIYDYYKRLAASINIPLMIYNHPSAGGGLGAKDIAKMFEIDNITSVKWSVNDYYGMLRLKDITCGEMNIINGSDEMLVSGLAAGADAGIGTTYNVMLPWYKEIYRLFKEGKNEEARAVQYKANAITECIIANRTIPATKYMCKMMGFDVGEARFPQRQMAGAHGKKLEEELKKLEWPFI